MEYRYTMTIDRANENMVEIRPLEAKEVLRIAPDGRIFWNEREIESDNDFRTAMLELRDALASNALLPYDYESLRSRLEVAEMEKEEFINLLAQCRDSCGEWNETDLSVEAVGNPDVVPARVKEALDVLTRERDEAIAYGEKLRTALRQINGWDRIIVPALQLSRPSALSKLRQEIRSEALEEAAVACEAQLDLAEQERANRTARDARDTDEEVARLRHASAVNLYNAGPRKCAAAIRALMEKRNIG